MKYPEELLNEIDDFKKNHPVISMESINAIEILAKLAYLIGIKNI